MPRGIDNHDQRLIAIRDDIRNGQTNIKKIAEKVGASEGTVRNDINGDRFCRTVKVINELREKAIKAIAEHMFTY